MSSNGEDFEPSKGENFESSEGENFESYEGEDFEPYEDFQSYERIKVRTLSPMKE